MDRINSWLNSFTLDQDCEVVNQHLGIKEYWYNCTVAPLYPVSIRIHDCHVRGGNPVQPPIPSTPLPNGTTVGNGQGTGGAGGGFVFGHISGVTNGSIVISDSSATDVPSFGVYTWDLDRNGARLQLRNVTLTNTATLRRFITYPDGAGSPPLVYAPVGASNAVMDLDGVRVVDEMATRPWLQALSNCPPGCQPNYCECNGTVLRGSVEVRTGSNGCRTNGSATRWPRALGGLHVQCSGL